MKAPIEHRLDRAPTISWEGPAGVLVNSRIAQWTAATISALKGAQAPSRPGRPCSVPCVRPVLRILRSAGLDLATWRRSPALSSKSPTNLNPPATHGCIKARQAACNVGHYEVFCCLLGQLSTNEWSESIVRWDSQYLLDSSAPSVAHTSLAPDPVVVVVVGGRCACLSVCSVPQVSDRPTLQGTLEVSFRTLASRA